MAQRRSPNRNATRRAPIAAAAPPPAPVALDRAEVVQVAERLAAVERERLALLEQRDRAVARAREAGVSWSVLAAAAGVSHPSLIERHRSRA